MAISSNQIKYVKSLHQRKFRQKYQKFIAEGTKIAREALERPASGVVEVYAEQEWIDRHAELLKGQDAAVFVVDARELSRISALTTPNQVLLVMDLPAVHMPERLRPQGLYLYLDGIRDPGNLGAILRIADWFGLSAVCCTPDTVELTNPKVVQASMGAFLRVPFYPASFDSVRQALPALPVFAAAMMGEDLYTQVLPAAALLVIGNESAGVSPEILQRADHRLRIPKGPDGGAESLNAAVASGILCAFFSKPTP